jgi:hypothetical protein
MIYHVLKSRFEYGGPFAGSWINVSSFERIEDVETFLRIKKATVKKFDTRYETEPDSMGCFDLYRIEVEL